MPLALKSENGCYCEEQDTAASNSSSWDDRRISPCIDAQKLQAFVVKKRVFVMKSCVSS